MSYTKCHGEHSLLTTASGTAIEIRSSADRDTPIIFVGWPGAFILKAFAEHKGYTKTKIFLGDINEFISVDKKRGGQADQILDEIFDEYDPEKTGCVKYDQHIVNHIAEQWSAMWTTQDIQ